VATRPAGILNELWQQIVFAVAGGLTAEALHWYMPMHKPGREKQ
jgi:hypothetical protein